MAGKSTGKKSRFSGKQGTGDTRGGKRQKAYGIKQFLQPIGGQPQARGANDSMRDSSEEPVDELPSQTPAVGLLQAAAPTTTAQFTAPTGGPKLQTALLRSLQHRFATQQALETPAELPAAGSTSQLVQQQQPEAGTGSAEEPAQKLADVDEDEAQDEQDGFQIFSQLAYEPPFLSQRPADLGVEPGERGGAGASILNTSQHATQTQLALDQQPPAGLAAVDEEEEDLGRPGSQLLSQHQQQQQDDALRRVSGVSAASHKTTPALQSSDRVRCNDGGPSGQKMFPLFRKRDSLKRLYIVRHGESTYNAAMQAQGSSWADPCIFDALLTERGKQQASALRKQLAALDLPPDTLWITSPLQRAMQTFLLACPSAYLLGKGGCGSSNSSNAENSSVSPNGGRAQAPNVVVLHTISEKVVTSGDIGHPASVLRKHYPQLDSQLASIPELWWHCPPGRPNCALQKKFGSHETKQEVMSRIGTFRRWLQERPESVVVAVGHSSYWRTFEEVCRGTKPTHMRNCEYRLINF